MLDAITSDGQPFHLAEQRGQLTILHLFTTWAASAQEDVMQLKRVVARVQVFGILVDPEGQRLIDAWQRGSGATWPIAFVTPEAAEAYLGAKMIPTTLLLDRDGKVAWRRDGPLAPGELERAVEQVARQR